MADGVAPKDLYPLGMSLIKKLDTIKDQLGSSGPAAQSRRSWLRRGHDVADVERASLGKHLDNKAVYIQWNPDVGITLLRSEGTPKGTEAMKCHLRPEQRRPVAVHPMRTNKNSEPQADKPDRM